MTKVRFTPRHRGAFWQLPFQWIYYYGSNKTTGMWTIKLKSTLMRSSAKIQPKLKKLQKAVIWTKNWQRNPFSEGFFFELHSIWAINLRTCQKGLHLVFWNFLQLWHSWGCINSGDITVLRFIFDISVPQHHLAIFFILFHLKPAINSTNLASISLYCVCCFAKTTHELA